MPATFKIVQGDRDVPLLVGDRLIPSGTCVEFRKNGVLTVGMVSRGEFAQHVHDMSVFHAVFTVDGKPASADHELAGLLERFYFNPYAEYRSIQDLYESRVMRVGEQVFTS